jgi:transposase
MTEFEIASIKRQWEAGVPIKQIVLTMPYKQSSSLKYIWGLQRDGVLLPRQRKRGEDLVVEAYKNGMTNPYEIAEVYGYSADSVRIWLCRANLGRKRPEHNWKKKDTSAQTKAIIKCLKNGMSVSETAKKFGLTRQRVSAIKIRSEKNG